MTGVFTDNQPDFTWLKPHEEKTFVQYFMPYKGVGRVGNATRDAAVSLAESTDGTAVLKVYTTSVYEQAKIKVTQKNVLLPLYEHTANLSPEACYTVSFPAPLGLCGCTVTIFSGNKTLVEYTVYKKKLEPVPAPAEPLKAPEEMKSTVLHR